MVDAQNFVSQRVEHKVVKEGSIYHNKDSVYDHVLTNVIGLETTVTLGKRIGSFTVKLANFKNAAGEFDYKDFFNYNDIITIKIGRTDGSLDESGNPVDTPTLVLKGFLENSDKEI